MKVIEKSFLSISRAQFAGSNDCIVARLHDSELASNIVKFFLSNYLWNSYLDLLVIPINIDIFHFTDIVYETPNFEKMSKL